MQLLAGGAGTEHFLMAWLQALWAGYLDYSRKRSTSWAFVGQGDRVMLLQRLSPKVAKSEPVVAGQPGWGGLEPTRH